MRSLKKDYDANTLQRIKSLMEYDVEFIACKNNGNNEVDRKRFYWCVEYTQAGSIVEVIERQVDGYIGITAY